MLAFKLISNSPQHKPSVHGKGKGQAIVRAHNSETLFKRGAMVFHGHSSIEVIGHHRLHVFKG